MGATYLLLVALFAAALAGFVVALLRRSTGVLLFTSGALAGGLLVAIRGSPWVEAKGLAIASPAPLLLAMLGASVIWREGRRWLAVLIGAAIAAGVLWSNSLAYHDVNLAPHERFAELEQIGKQIAGEGPTLMTDYEPYGVRHFLRKADPEGASEFRHRPIALRRGGTLEKLQTADIDEFQLSAILVYRTLVLRRSPTASRPPSVYRLVARGRYYDVWQRSRAREGRIAEHLSLGNSVDPTATPECRDVSRLGSLAGPHGVLATVERPAPVVRPLDRASVPRSWGEYGGGKVAPLDAGTIDVTMTVPKPGRYGVWVGGAFRREVEVLIDGRETADERHRLSHAGQFEPMGEAQLEAGPHRLTLRYGPADLHPGSDGEPFPLGPLALARATAEEPVEYVRPRDARSLCGKRLDWVEAVRG
jgi:hypothetical protein